MGSMRRAKSVLLSENDTVATRDSHDGSHAGAFLLLSLSVVCFVLSCLRFARLFVANLLLFCLRYSLWHQTNHSALPIRHRGAEERLLPAGGRRQSLNTDKTFAVIGTKCAWMVYCTDSTDSIYDDGRSKPAQQPLAVPPAPYRVGFAVDPARAAMNIYREGALLTTLRDLHGDLYPAAFIGGLGITVRICAADRYPYEYPEGELAPGRVTLTAVTIKKQASGGGCDLS